MGVKVKAGPRVPSSSPAMMRALPHTPSYDGGDEFLGAQEAVDGTLVDPMLTSYVATKRSAKTEILKQERKTREELTAMRKEGKGAKGDGKGANADGK